MRHEQLWRLVDGVMRSWKDIKWFIEHSISFSSDSLHVIVGVLLQAALALVFRKTLASWLPWLVLFVLTCVNEAADILVDQWPERGLQYSESVKDVLLTMFLPTMMLLGTRFVPRLYVSVHGRK